MLFTIGRNAGGIFQIANIVPSLIHQIDTHWRAVNAQHSCCSYINVISKRQK